MLGLDGPVIDRIFEATRGMASLRCRDEALDECLATGRFVQIFKVLTEEGRQSQLLGQEDDLESWADDALKQCAVYELRFISKTKGGRAPMGIETVRDGRVKIRFETPPEGVKAALTRPLGEALKGRSAGGNNPFFVSVKCDPPTPMIQFICSPGADSTAISVRINELDLKYHEYYIDYVTDPFSRSESEFSKSRVVGDDKFSIEFEGGIFSLQGLVKTPYNTASIPFPDWGNNFYMAHKKDQIGGPRAAKLGIKNNQRGVYPTIFHFTYADQNAFADATVSDSTEIELIHKPEPKPFRKPEVDPIRRPLKPKPIN